MDECSPSNVYYSTKRALFASVIKYMGVCHPTKYQKKNSILKVKSALRIAIINSKVPNYVNVYTHIYVNF